MVNTTLAAGWTFQDMYEAILKVLKPYGIVAGYAPPFPGIKNPRGAHVSAWPATSCSCWPRP